MKAIRYHCRSPHCPNWMVLHEDRELPRDWTCAACDDALLTLQLEEMERHEAERTLKIIPRDGPITVECGDGRRVAVPLGGTLTVRIGEDGREIHDVDF